MVGLRLMKIAAGGPEADKEARRMVSEKVAAGLSLQTKAMSGALGLSPPAIAAHTLAHYRRKVRANRRRLSKG